MAQPESRFKSERESVKQAEDKGDVQEDFQSQKPIKFIAEDK